MQTKINKRLHKQMLKMIPAGLEIVGYERNDNIEIINKHYRGLISVFTKDQDGNAKRFSMKVVVSIYEIF